MPVFGVQAAHIQPFVRFALPHRRGFAAENLRCHPDAPRTAVTRVFESGRKSDPGHGSLPWGCTLFAALAVFVRTVGVFRGRRLTLRQSSRSPHRHFGRLAFAGCPHPCRSNVQFFTGKKFTRSLSRPLHRDTRVRGKASALTAVGESRASAELRENTAVAFGASARPLEEADEGSNPAQNAFENQDSGAAFSPNDVKPVGFTFSAGGLTFSYLLGAADALIQKGVITQDTPIAGSSAGALVAMIVGLGLPAKQAQEAALRINAGCREGGARGRLLSLLEKECHEMIPKDAVERLAERAGLVNISVCRLTHSTHLLPRGLVLSTFTDADDIIEAILSSCCIPFYAASTPFWNFRGWPAVDGLFGVDLERVGCPPTGAERDIAVSAFNHDEASIGRIVPAGFHDTNTGQNDLICPGLHTPPDLSTPHLLSIALALPPADDSTLNSLFDKGFRDAEAWLHADRQSTHNEI